MTLIPTDKLIDIANRVPLFKELNANETEQLITITNIVKMIKAGEKFISDGKYNDSFYILLSGKATVYQ